MDYLLSMLKALTGAVTTGLGSLYLALDDEVVTQQEWIAVAIATLGGLAAVWAVPNLDPHGRRQQDSVQPPDHDDAGRIDPLYALVVAILAVVLLVLLLAAFDVRIR